MTTQLKEKTIKKKKLPVIAMAALVFFFYGIDSARAENYFLPSAPTELHFQYNTSEYDYIGDTIRLWYGSDEATGTTIELNVCPTPTCTGKINVDTQDYVSEHTYEFQAVANYLTYAKWPRWQVCIDDTICEEFENPFTTTKDPDVQSTQDIRLMYGLGIIIFLLSTILIIKTYTP